MMKLSKPNIPKELDADVAMAVVIEHMDSLADKKPFYTYEFKGVSERTALGDELNLIIRNKQNAPPVVKFSLKRDSLYHILPEYLFHPLDRYLGTDGDTEEFEKRYKEQEEQKEKSLTYFKPFDQYYQNLRIKYQHWLNEHIFSGNQFLSDFITAGQRVDIANSYIKAVYQCIPWLRNFRGNDDMVKAALGYAFEGHAEIQKTKVEVTEALSENIHSNLNGTLDDLYCGSTFITRVYIWKVFYQVKIKTGKHLSELKQQIEEFSTFFSQWFLSVEDKLEITFGDRWAFPELSDARIEEGVFLNYSTQLI